VTIGARSSSRISWPSRERHGIGFAKNDLPTCSKNRFWRTRRIRRHRARTWAWPLPGGIVRKLMADGSGRKRNRDRDPLSRSPYRSRAPRRAIPPRPQHARRPARESATVRILLSNRHGELLASGRAPWGAISTTSVKPIRRSRSVDDDLSDCWPTTRRGAARGRWRLVFAGDFMTSLGLSYAPRERRLTTEPKRLGARTRSGATLPTTRASSCALCWTSHRDVFDAPRRFRGPLETRLTFVHGTMTSNFTGRGEGSPPGSVCLGEDLGVEGVRSPLALLS